MSVETLGAIGTVVLKFIWVPISGFVAHIWWSIRRDKIKLDNTLSKTEAKDLIALNLAPIKQEIELKLDNQNARIDTLLSSFQASVESIHETNKTINEKLDHIQNNVSEVKSNVAVLTNDLSNVKSRLDRQNIG